MPRLPDEIDQRLTVMVNQSVTKNKRTRTWKAEAKRIREQLGREFEHDPSIPQVEAIQNRLSAARKNPDPLDEPWSIGISEADGIAPEDLPDIISIWRTGFLAGDLVSIRQAKWIARLRRVVKVENEIIRLQRLADVASVYALYEAVNEQMDALDTTELDIALNFPIEVYHASVEAGFVKPTYFGKTIAGPHFPSLSYSKNLVDGEEERLYLYGSWSAVQINIAPVDEIDEAHRRIKVIISRVTDDWMNSVLGVRNIWLRAFSERGHRWLELTGNAKLGIVVDLTKEVVEHMRTETNQFSRGTMLKWDRPFRPSATLSDHVGVNIEPVDLEPLRNPIETE